MFDRFGIEFDWQHIALFMFAGLIVAFLVKFILTKSPPLNRAEALEAKDARAFCPTCNTEFHDLGVNCSQCGVRLLPVEARLDPDFWRRKLEEFGDKTYLAWSPIQKSAAHLAPVLVEICAQLPKKLQLNHSEYINMSQRDAFEIHTEAQILFAHVLDRIVLAKHDMESRDTFMDLLWPMIHNYFEDFVGEGKHSDYDFRDHVNRRLDEYANCRTVGTRSGEPLSDSLLWQASKNIAAVVHHAEDITYVLCVMSTLQELMIEHQFHKYVLK